MQVICIQNKFDSWDQIGLYNNDQITLYKIYSVSEQEFYNFYKMVRIENGKSYPKEWFMPLEKWRNIILNKLLYE